MNKNRPDFFEPKPKMPVYSLSVIVYNNGQECSLFEDDMLEHVRSEIEQLFKEYGSEKQFMVAYENVGSATRLSVGYIDLEGNERAIPDEWLKKTVVVGKNRELRLVGDRIPITVPNYPSMEVQFVDF